MSAMELQKIIALLPLLEPNSLKSRLSLQSAWDKTGIYLHLTSTMANIPFFITIPVLFSNSDLVTDVVTKVLKVIK